MRGLRIVGRAFSLSFKPRLFDDVRRDCGGTRFRYSQRPV